MDKRACAKSDYYKYYSSTSEAYDLKREPYRRKETKKAKRFKRPKTVFIYDGQTKPNISVYSVISILLVFACSLGIVITFALVFNKQNSNEILSKEVKKIEDSNVLLSSQLSKQYDINEIEKIASTKLGMGKPKSHQIMHIKVPKQSYAIKYDSAVSETEKQGLISKLSKLLQKAGIDKNEKK